MIAIFSQTRVTTGHARIFEQLIRNIFRYRLLLSRFSSHADDVPSINFVMILSDNSFTEKKTFKLNQLLSAIHLYNAVKKIEHKVWYS